MLNLKSVIDGFKVVMGSWLIHIAALLTMVIFVRPPDYPEDAGKTREAKIVYSVLIILHFVLTIVKFVKLYVSDKISMLGPAFMLIVVILLIHLIENWAF